MNQIKNGIDLHINQLEKSYGKRKVLHQTQLQVQAGEFVALVGRSGCGKSTLLRLIAGLETVNQGRILLNDQLVEGINTNTRMMFQEARLLPWKTVLENVALGLPSEKILDAKKVLQQVGLADRENDWPARLSGGQRQRVALARALVHNPKLLLLDEPLGALDALTRIEMHELIESLWLSNGFTALLVTHDVQEALALADRIILIEDGKIALNEVVSLARPRSRGDVLFASLEKKILDRVLQREEEFGPIDTSWLGVAAHGLRWAI